MIRASTEAVAGVVYTLEAASGDLSDFFETYNCAFDIVYYDACGAFPVAKPNTLEPILKLLAAQRLEPLSVLITTFTGPPEDCDDYTQILSKFFSFRYRDLPKFVFEAGMDPELFQHGEHTEQGGQFHVFVSSNTERLYSEFLTRFHIDLSRSWAPHAHCQTNHSSRPSSSLTRNLRTSSGPPRGSPMTTRHWTVCLKGLVTSCSILRATPFCLSSRASRETAPETRSSVS